VSEQGERVRPSTVAEVLETDEAKGLLESARESGSLSTDEIAAGLGELELDAAQLDDFYHALEELQIEVVDDGREEPEREIAPATREITTDSLQLFLKDIGKVDLLTAAQEVELAKRIERGEHSAKQRRSSITARASSSRPTRRGGSARPSPARSRTRLGRSGCPCTSSRS
jgi:DNA-directed RNA polymerase sigma subunit (sigma70/sigma32)